ncbi:GNAT family N-acetyltransferase [Iodidimonas sp. SYSU 1G8]|uniref:GNAT family N-acetyltransferase n=1 Tax=Iodidimonas sp. SYSU 1G8 TaxID=3133967 RepID=UPI0031FE9251
MIPIYRPIETVRLVLRPYKRADLPFIPALIGDWDVARWLSRAPFPYTDQDARDWLGISRRIRWWRRGLPYVMTRRDDGAVLGGIGVSFDDNEIGYWMGKPYWGNGYATEAVRGITERVFNRYGLKYLWAGVMPGNDKSCRVLERAGFGWQGTRRYRLRDGEGDVLYYRLERDVWSE